VRPLARTITIFKDPRGDQWPSHFKKPSGLVLFKTKLLKVLFTRLENTNFICFSAIKFVSKIKKFNVGYFQNQQMYYLEVFGRRRENMQYIPNAAVVATTKLKISSRNHDRQG
jgi:hypothetical protein